jgi:hypothetical protein
MMYRESLRDAEPAEHALSADLGLGPRKIFSSIRSRSRIVKSGATASDMAWIAFLSGSLA